ncbi:hypothetical protein GCM10008018_72640 [Paenibacillus marchantiophytorum]|uniref:SLH domain-containing protein n=1 Tax=Paenibacillus marchantiophytorum TaxID=1619310 RepID=A0ABQ1FJE5_9BACL|nr:S-layer homology domain-containing protein [Paenibacillus marchantiophytorum]GGA18101.1 hypothetical protein GCM10008018_72640 [Paenibacillus marchantiophytorum]
MKKRVLGILLTGLVVGGSAAYVVHANPSVTGGSSVSAATYSKGFTDIAADFWAASQIADARGQGYIDGYADGSFQPNRKVSRAEFVKMAVVALHINVDSAGSNPWYKVYMDAAKKASIYADGDFSDNNFDAPMQRLEMAKIAVRAAGQNTTDTKKWMYLATTSGLIQGMDDAGGLGIEEATNRAQSVTIIGRIQNIKSGKTVPADKYAISAAEIYWHKTNILTMLPQYFAATYNKFGTKFRTDLLRFDGKDGYSEVEKYVVVDMDDPNDPNRNLITSDFRWRKKYKTSVEYAVTPPSNAYALLSINHIVVDASETINNFRFAQIDIGPFNSNGTVDDSGKLIDVTTFSPFIEEYKMLLSGYRNIEKGHHDIRFITGQLLPKGDLFKNDTQVTVHREAAVELGEQVVNQIYYSTIDYSLSR